MQNTQNRHRISWGWVPGCWVPPAAAGQAAGSPRLDSTADRNQTQECRDRCLDQDRRQGNKQGPLQKVAMNEEEQDPRDPPSLN